MRQGLLAELRSLLPAWVVCLAVPLPAVLLWRSSDGRAFALGCFFIGCASLVAWSFSRAEDRRGPWREKMLALGLALLAALVVLSLLCLGLNDARDYDVPLVALTILVPSLGMVPYLTLLTRKPLAAVVFTVALVACMKLLGGTVVVLVYGWDATLHGHTRMPWTNPNLLVWVFWTATALCSALLYVLGWRRFRALLAGSSPGDSTEHGLQPKCDVTGTEGSRAT
jgi:hypothetical protein